MPFMLRISFEILPLAVFVPHLWGGVVLLALTTIFAYRRRADGRPVPGQGKLVPWILELASLAVIPLLILGWGLHFWPDRGRSPYEAWALRGLDAFAFMQVCLAVWLVWRHRFRLWSTVTVAGLSMWWCAGALFTSSMAVTNTWL